MKRAIILAGLLLPACSGHDHSQLNFGGAPRSTVTTGVDTFGVYDNRSASKLFVIVQRDGDTGLVWNANFSHHPKPIFKQAAEMYLAQSGRRCAVGDGSEILNQRWEFEYQCA